jgi:hypothetical protein
MIRRPRNDGLTTGTLRCCWVACSKCPASYCMVASSHIVVVAQQTGEIIFVGSANDEG